MQFRPSNFDKNSVSKKKKKTLIKIQSRPKLNKLES